MVLLSAGFLTFLLGAVHSYLGERLIFNQWPKQDALVLRKYRGIIRASWHIVSVLGWGLAAGLIWLSQHSELLLVLRPFLVSFIVALAVSGTLVIVWTRGRHPGGVVLWMIAALLMWAVMNSTNSV